MSLLGDALALYTPSTQSSHRPSRPLNSPATAPHAMLAATPRHRHASPRRSPPSPYSHPGALRGSLSLPFASTPTAQPSAGCPAAAALVAIGAARRGAGGDAARATNHGSSMIASARSLV